MTDHASRRLVRIGWDAGWDAHEAFADTTLAAERARLWDEGFTACAQEHMRQRSDATHPIRRDNPYGEGDAHRCYQLGATPETKTFRCDHCGRTWTP